MVYYPTYSVNGVPMQDAAGRWHEHEEMQILPVHAGLRATTLELNGLDGEVLLAQSPLEAQDFPLKLIVNSNDERGNHPNTFPEQLIQMRRNVESLYRAFKLPRMTGNGLAQITLELSPSESITAEGLLIANADIEREPHTDYAEATFLFRIPSGKWRGQQIYERITTTNTIRGHKGVVPGLASSTAPVNDALISITGPFDWMQVMNEFGDGFTYTNRLEAGQCVTIDTKNWRATAPYSHPDGASKVYPPNSGYQYSPHLSQVGRTGGTALTLWPQDDGAVVYAHGDGRTPGSTYLHVSTREAFV